jgi:TRAP-type C4-dicarboxylate transport system permease small subunit
MTGADAETPRRAGLAGRLYTAAEWIGAALFGALFALFIVGVAAREVFRAPIPWIDELAVILLLWSVFWAGAFLVPDKDQVVFDLLHSKLSPRGRRIMGVVAALACAGLLAFALPACVDYVGFMWRERTPVLRWRFDHVYAIFILFLVAVILRQLWAALRLARGRDQPA